MAADLPRSLTPLIGREREVAAVRGLVLRDGVRLVTLTGPGGVGKTRLALECAAGLAEVFPDGVWFVGLAPIGATDFVLPTIAHALGIRDGGVGALADRLAALLRGKRGLLLLDNFEQVVAAAPFVADLLAACPALSVLVTSRMRLHLAGEHEHAVPPLALPPPDTPLGWDGLVASEAVRLFAARAQELQPDFAVSGENIETVVAVCRRLDGLPLAIELVAAWVKLLPLPALLNRLERRLPMLTGGGRDVPARQQTMRETIAWSYDLLSPEEQRLFRRLAVFVGGFTLDAAEAVCGSQATGDRRQAIGGVAVDSVLDGIASLLDKSLLNRDTGSTDDARLRMLETVREYGLDQLTARNELDDAKGRHAAQFAAFAERAEPELWRASQVAWLDRLAADHDNLRAAFDWLCRAETSEDCLRLAGACGMFWYIRGHMREGLMRTLRALAIAEPGPTAIKGRALNTAALLATRGADLSEAEALAREGAAVWRAVGDRRGEADAQFVLGVVEDQRAHWDAAIALYQDQLSLWRDVGDDGRLARVLMVLGGTAHKQGDVTRARATLQEAIALFRKVGDRRREAFCLRHLAMFDNAERRWVEAAHGYRESLLAMIEVRDSSFVEMALLGLAETAASLGRHDVAVRLLGASDGELRRSGARHFPYDLPSYQRAEALGRQTLGEARYAAAFSVGQDLDRRDWIALADEVVAAAQDQTGPSRGRGEQSVSGLTAREREVLRLLVEGRSNAEIADALFVGSGTVKTHVANILAKLGVPTRVAAATYAVRHGLV
jgi:predicted ATPase/DNA-binding CsgD family transcriptional regulator